MKVIGKIAESALKLYINRELEDEDILGLYKDDYINASECLYIQAHKTYRITKKNGGNNGIR